MKSPPFYMPQEWAVVAFTKALEHWEGLKKGKTPATERERVHATLLVYQSHLDACSIRDSIDKAERS